MSKKKQKKAVAKKKVEKKKEAAYDKFHRRIGTQGHTIDLALNSKGKTIQQLAKECKLSTGRIATHLRDLLDKGFITKSKEGKYAIK